MNNHNDDPFYEPPKQPPQATISRPVKTRKRGFSLRTQLLNKSVNQSTADVFPTDRASENIELQAVDNSYSSNEIRSYDNENTTSLYQNGFSLNESVIDLDSEPLYRNNNNSDHYKTSRLQNLKKAFNALRGVTNELPSLGGRRIPITLDISTSHEPYEQSKRTQHQKLLVDKRQNSPYISNLITSSRYTIFSFLPRQLIAQFSKVANCYFLVVSILQLIPSWSTTGTTTTIIPLSIFITISILREGYDDIRRHKLDKFENNRVTEVLRKQEGPLGHFNKSKSSISRLRSSFDFDSEEEAEEDEGETAEENSFNNVKLLKSNGIDTQRFKWKNLKVGQIVRLESDDWVPADILLLTSDQEMGEAFVETMALDGETNLKSKIPNQELHKVCNTADGLNKLNGISMLSEDPNLDLYNFEGSLDLPGHQRYPLNSENILYRGSIIRNTNTCLGLVIFTGEETKIRMNAIKNPRIKAPKLQKAINMIVAFMVLMVLSLSLFSFMGERILFEKYKARNWYIYGEDVGVAPAVTGFIIMYNTLIPLSLYVTMEIIKLMQMLLLQWDIDMYHQESNTPAEARTATILEELGQVSYIFSDKTGTLTDNIMIFRKFSVAGTAWIHDLDLVQNENNEIDGNELELAKSISPKQGSIRFAGRPSMASLSNTRPSMNPSLITARTAKQQPEKPNEIKSSSELIRYIQSNPQSFFAKKAIFFLLSVALCHSCLPKKVKKKPAKDDLKAGSSDGSVAQSSSLLAGNVEENEEDEEEEEIDYQASSPDELALVQAASDMGFIVFDRKQKKLTLKTYPNGFEAEPLFQTYEVLETVEFTSSRKRMSVIVKFPDESIVLLCKGADNVILERLVNKEMVKSKTTELNKRADDRKRNEVDFILQKRMSHEFARTSLDITSGPRLSLSSLGKSQGAGPSPLGLDRVLSTEIPIIGSPENDELNEIVNGSRKSLQLQQKERYGYNGSYIPNDKLLNNDEYILEKTIEHIDEFSTDGLRTLMYSYRIIDLETFNKWSESYSKAKTSLTNRAEMIESIGCQLENNLRLLGATAIEDKLQLGVPEAIEKLRRAGIKMWMLTGDKRETAINIGYSCRLIKDYSKVVILSNETDEDLSSVMAAAELEINQGNVAHCVVVVDGSTLASIESDLTLMSLFISLGMHSDSVIVCRASPSQKASMVTHVRSLNKNKVTLAIGDGANDIAMIQSADVGVGITGKEGLQAARTSDYSIAQFRYLLKLLLVHGRYNYIRTSKFVLCTFYKELTFYLTQLLYQRYTLFTGSSLYESWSLSMFNTLFTSLPVLCIGMFDKDLRPSTLIAVPELYAKGRLSESFNLKLFIMWVILAASQSVALCFTLWNIYGFHAIKDNTTYPLGCVMFTVLIVIINTKCNIIEMHSISKICWISWCVSCFGWWAWCLILVALYKSKDSTIFYVQHGLFEQFGKDVTFWASILILIIIGLAIDFVFQIVRSMFVQTDTEIFQILEKKDHLRAKFELNSFDELKQSWTWLHESQLIESDIENYSDLKRGAYNTKSFLKKGSLHPSAKTQNRKRKGTMVNPSEPLPGSPSVVKFTGDNERYTEGFMLPSGKIIRKRGNNEEGNSGRVKSLFKIGSSNKSVEDIDEILDRRMRQLEEQ